MPARQLLGIAIADLKKAPAIRITGTVLASGTKTSFRMIIVPGTGCEGIIAIAGKGTALVVGLGTAVWTEPSRQLWTASGVPARLLPRLAGRFLSGTAAQGTGGNLSGLCQLTTLAVPAGAAGALKHHGDATLAGKRTLLLTGPHAEYWISDTTAPGLVRASGLVPAPGAVSFAVQQSAPAITAPPASRIVSPAALARGGLPE